MQWAVPPGDVAETITVTTNTDCAQEETETFFVDLTTPISGSAYRLRSQGVIATLRRLSVMVSFS